MAKEPWLIPPTQSEQFLMEERDERNRRLREYWAKKRAARKEVNCVKAS